MGEELDNIAPPHLCPPYSLGAKNPAPCAVWPDGEMENENDQQERNLDDFDDQLGPSFFSTNGEGERFAPYRIDAEPSLAKAHARPPQWKLPRVPPFLYL